MDGWYMQICRRVLFRDDRISSGQYILTNNKPDIKNRLPVNKFENPENPFCAEIRFLEMEDYNAFFPLFFQCTQCVCVCVLMFLWCIFSFPKNLPSAKIYIKNTTTRHEKKWGRKEILCV